MQCYRVVPGEAGEYVATSPSGECLAVGVLSAVLAAITVHGEARGRFHQVIRLGGAA